MRPFLVLVLFLLASPAWAQQTRTVVQVPVNFRNDTSQPRTLAQLKADGDVFANRVFGPQNTHGAVTVTTTVLAYVTIDMDKGCNGTGATLPALNMSEFYQKLDAALAARGEKRTGDTWVVSPTTFVKCSHTTRYREAWDYSLAAEEAATWMAWYGLGLPMSINWTCRAAAGSSTLVTLSGFCGPSTQSANGRDFTSITGQGGRSLTANDRQRLGWLQSSEQVTVSTSWQGPLVRMESSAPGVKRLLIPGMGIEVSYLGKPGEFGWDARGLTGHVLNTSRRIDFTPDDCWLFCTTALAPSAAPFAYNGLQLTVLSIDANVAMVDIRPDGGTVPPPPPPSPVDCTVSAWSAWSACVNGSQSRTRTVVTQPANGGAVCPALTETQACIALPPPSDLSPDLSPDDLITVRAGTPVTMRVTVSGVAKVEGHWIVYGQDNNKSTAKSGDTYSFTETPGSTGTRKWYFVFRSSTGAVLGKTDVRTITVIP